MSEISAGNLGTETVGNPGGTTLTASGTSTSTGEASQSATADSFIPEGLDLNTLPPNIRAVVDKINKDMVRGFTEKTSKLSETIKSESQKAAEAYREKATQYDQIAGQKAFVDKWNDYVKEQERQSNQGGAEPGDPILSEMKAQLNEMNQKMQISELSQITNAFADAVDEKGTQLHPDFDNLNSIQLGKMNENGKVEEYSLLRACIELADGKNPQEKLTNGYKVAKAMRDSIFEEGKKAGMGRLEKKALNGTQLPSSSSNEVLSVTDKKPKNAHEAFAMARRGQMVSRD